MSILKKLKMKNGGDIPLPEAIKLLKEEIVEEVKLVAHNRKMSLFHLVDLGKELQILETKMLEDKSKKPTRKELEGAF